MDAKEVGLLLQSRRQAMGMSLNDLTRRMGGSPGASFLSKIETGKVSPSRSVAERLAKALNAPEAVVLRLAGYADDNEQRQAVEEFRALLYERPPVMTHVPVLSLTGETTKDTRPRVLLREEEVRIVDLAGPANEPFTGEVLISLDRKPQEGNGVVVLTDGYLAAFTWHNGPKGAWLEDGRGQPRGGKFRVVGVIIRVSKEVDLG